MSEPVELTGPKWEQNPWDAPAPAPLTDGEARRILADGAAECEAAGDPATAAAMRGALADPAKFAEAKAKLDQARAAGEV